MLDLHALPTCQRLELSLEASGADAAGVGVHRTELDLSLAATAARIEGLSEPEPGVEPEVDDVRSARRPHASSDGCTWNEAYASAAARTSASRR